MSDLEVRKFFKFDEGDLAANRSGKLSASQKSKLESDEKGADQIIVGAGIFFLVIGVVVAYFVAGDVAAKLFSGTSLGSSDMLTLFLGAGLPLGLFGFFGIGAIRIGTSKLDNSVQSVEGRVKFVKVEKRIEDPTSEAFRYKMVQQYELRVGKHAFENVDEELLNLIEEGDTYAFYYTKQTKQILSCEFIAKGK
ncbi:MAG: hypothetical protein JNM55_17025 [Anaerolineales bacterium]|nr:hypothetical protein [Anaerolineales bacterium]